MSKIGVLIAVGLALLLGVAAWLLLGPSAPAPTHETSAVAVRGPLLAFHPSDVREVSIQLANDRDQRLVRDSDAWMLVINSPETADADAWPVAGGQVRALLSVLQALPPVGVATSGSIDDPAAVVTLHLHDGSTQSLRLGAEAVGGRRLAQANGGEIVFIDQLLVEALTSPGPRAWREMRVFPNVGAETSRLEIIANDAELSLARVRGVWRLREPVRAPADPTTVERLLNQLAALSVERWIDDPGALRGGATLNGAMRIAAERDRRIVNDLGEPEVVTDRREVVIGPSADLSGVSRLVFVGPAGTPAMVSADAVSSLQVRPESLLSRRAADVTASQIASIAVTTAGDSTEPLTFEMKRTLDGWIRIESGVESDVPTGDVAALLSLLTERRADDVAVAPSAPSDPDAVLELRGFDGGLLTAVSIHATTDGVTIVTDDIRRQYRGVATPAILNPGTKPSASAIDDPVK